MTYYCKRHRDKNAYAWEDPDEKAFWKHHREVHGGTKKAERRMGVF